MFSKKGFVTVCLVILAALLITGCTPTTPVAVTGVTLDQATMTLTAGGATGTLVATVAPADATDKSVTWSSSALAVATVANGVVTPLTAGTTTIIVATVDGGLIATCTVTVNPAAVAVTGVTLNHATMTLTAGGATGMLVAIVAPATATDKSVTWSSSALAVATVANGVVTPLTAGTTTIIVATVDGGFTATCTVTVNPAAVAVTGVTLNHATMTLTAGGATGTLVATVAPANATNKSVTWSSSALAVATVANGVVTPLTAGTTTIIAATVDGGFTATCAVTVNPAVAVGDSYGGGIVAYVLQSGDLGYDANVQHGLIAATVDQSTGIQWYNGSYVVTGATSAAIGTGKANTTAIVEEQGAGSYAAKLCNDLTVGSYSDWYLPSKDELDKLYINKVAIGNFAAYYYWSSSEYTASYALYQYFGNGSQAANYKYYTYRVRAVRAF